MYGVLVLMGEQGERRKGAGLGNDKSLGEAGLKECRFVFLD